MGTNQQFSLAIINLLCNVHVFKLTVGAQNDFQLPLATLQGNEDQQPLDVSRAASTLPSMQSLPMKPGDNKATLYLGAFQIIAMPFGAGNLPGMGSVGAPTSFPGMFGPSNRE